MGRSIGCACVFAPHVKTNGDNALSFSSFGWRVYTPTPLPSLLFLSACCALPVPVFLSATGPQVLLSTPPHRTLSRARHVFLAAHLFSYSFHIPSLSLARALHCLYSYALGTARAA